MKIVESPLGECSFVVHESMKLVFASEKVTPMEAPARLIAVEAP